MPQSVVGDKTFDSNEDGLAHVGMLPGLIAGLESQGLTSPIGISVPSRMAYARRRMRCMAVARSSAATANKVVAFCTYRHAVPRADLEPAGQLGVGVAVP